MFQDDVIVNKEQKREICEKVFNAKRNLKKHFTIVHDSGIRKSFKCNICANSSQTLSTLNLHIKSVHGGSKKYTCESCVTRSQMLFLWQ